MYSNYRLKLRSLPLYLRQIPAGLNQPTKCRYAIQANNFIDEGLSLMA